MLISIQAGKIPANLHFQQPNQEIPALLDGRLKVVNTNTKFEGGLMALNSFGFGGANAHLLIQPNVENSGKVGFNFFIRYDFEAFVSSFFFIQKMQCK
jgi:acyl transferase domain-containing protein